MKRRTKKPAPPPPPPEPPAPPAAPYTPAPRLIAYLAWAGLEGDVNAMQDLLYNLGLPTDHGSAHYGLGMIMDQLSLHRPAPPTSIEVALVLGRFATPEGGA
jgi:hypothetical protein